MNRAGPAVSSLVAMLLVGATAGSGSLFVAPARGDEKTPDWKQLARDPSFWSAVEAQAGPGSGAVILSRTGETEVELLEGKFALITIERMVEAIVDPSRPGVVTRWFLPETPDRKVREISGAAYLADGSVRKLDKKNITEEALYAAFPLYKDLHTRRIIAPDSSAHTIIEVTWRWVAGGGEGGGNAVSAVGSLENPTSVRGEDTGGGYVVHVHRFEDRLPVRLSAYTLTYPTELGTGGVAQHYVTFGPVPPPVSDHYFSPDGDRQRLRWEMRDRPALLEEPLAPPLGDRAAFIALSPSALTWGDLGKVYHREHMLPAMTADKPVQARLEALTRGLTTPEEKAAAITRYVQTEVKSVPVTLLEQGFEPHPARAVMEAGYGDSRDKSILAVTLLRGAGLRAWPVLVRTRGMGHLEEGLVTLRSFDRCVVALELGGARTWCDPAWGHGIGDLPADVAGVKGLIIDDENVGLVDAGASARGGDRVTRILRGTLSATGELDATLQLEARGGVADEIRARLASADDAAKAAWVSGLFARPGGGGAGTPALTAGALEVGGLSRPGEPVTLKAALRGTISSAGSAGALVLNPFPAEPETSFPELPAGERRAPIYIPVAITEVDSIALTIPAALQWPEAKRSVRESSPAGRFVLDLRAEGTVLTGVRTIEVRRGQWPPENYDRIRAYAEAVRARPEITLQP